MHQPYQLAPIPPFKGTPAPCHLASVDSSSPLSSASPHTPADGGGDGDIEMRSPEASPSVGPGSSSPLNHHALSKKRPSALNQARLAAYPADQGGAEAVVPPTPFIAQQLAPPAPASPTVPEPVFASRGLPERFQPKRTLQGKGFPGQQGAAQQTRVLVQQRQAEEGEADGAGNPSCPEMHLTPPPTPDSAREPPLSSVTAGLMPPTPSTSPVATITLIVPATISGKALQSHKLNPLFAERYELGDELGSGGFGFVVQACRREDDKPCAVKFIYKHKVAEASWIKDRYWGDDNDENGVGRTHDGSKRVPLEAYVLRTIKHRGVVGFLDLYEDQKYMYLVMEHHGSPWQAPPKGHKATTSPSQLQTLSLRPPHVVGARGAAMPRRASPLGRSPRLPLFVPPQSSPGLTVPRAPAMMRRSSCDLFECIEQHSRLSEAQAKYVFAQLVDVVGCLHYNGFVHRDIKDENIVIDDSYRVKLIDFGSTYLFDYRNPPESLGRFFGTMNYAAPEILRTGSYRPMAAEIWSLGILLSILVAGESMFKDTDAIKNYRPSLASGRLSAACKDILWRCLAERPEDRWNCFKLRTHPWLANSQWQFSMVPRDARYDCVDRVRYPPLQVPPPATQ